MDKIQKTDEEWKKQLGDEAYDVARKDGTEAPFSGEYVDNKEKGVYKCKSCGLELFSSDTKFDSGTGWPSFDDPMNLENVTLHKDDSLGVSRTEVRCARCDAHLGHVFEDGPADTTGKRYCINSVCLDFEKKDEKEKDE